MTTGTPQGDPAGDAESREPAEGVINKADLPLFFNPALAVFSGEAQPGAEGEVEFRGVEPPQEPEAGEPESAAVEPPPAPAVGADKLVQALIAQNQALVQRTEALATLVESTTRSITGLADRIPQAPAAPPEPEPLDPALKALAERMGVEPADLQAAVDSRARRLAAAEVREGFTQFASTYQALETKRAEVEGAMRQSDPAYDPAKAQAFLAASPIDKLAYNALVAQGQPLEAERFAWKQAGQTPAPKEPPAESEPAPAPGARAAGAPPRVTSAGAPNDAAERREHLAKLAEKASRTGDRSPEVERFAMYRLFGVERAEDLAPPRPRAQVRKPR